MNNTENRRESTKVDIEKALKLPHLVKTGQFQFRYWKYRNVHVGGSQSSRSVFRTQVAAGHERISYKKSPGTEVNITEFQKFLLNQKKIKKSKEEIKERTLLAQHKDVWTKNIKKLQNGSDLLSTNMEVLLFSFIKDLSNSDSTKAIFNQILDQVNQSNDYHSNLR